jgi:PD-(D/E)XK nuclease superfamily
MSRYQWSASQIETFLKCGRKWGWSYLAKIPSLPNKSQSLGLDTHKWLENYKLTGHMDQLSPAASIAMTALEYLPPTTADMKLEKEWKFDSGRHFYHGYCDVEYPGSVWDYKTTSSLSYAKTEVELAYDVQAVLYATANFVRYEVPRVTINWLYMQTKGARKAKLVSLPMYPDHASMVFSEIETVADEMSVLRDGGVDSADVNAYVLSLGHNPGHCEQYGGCAYRSLCNLSPSERIRGTMNQGQGQSLFDRIKAQQKTEAPAEVSTDTVKINPPEYQPPPAIVAVPKVVSEPPPEAVPPVASGLPPEVVITPSKRIKRPKTPPTTDGMMLYVDCRPQNNLSRESYEVYAEAHSRIFKDHGLADYRFKGFGEGQGLFKQVVTQVLDEWNPSSLVADTRQTETVLCLSLFLSRATEIVSKL